MSIYGNPVMMGGSGGGGGGSTNILSGTQSPTSSQGTNGVIYLKYGSILEVDSFTKLYSTSIPFGTNGSSVAARLAINDETSHRNLQAGGWNASGMAYYDSENQIGAYAGYSFGGPLSLSKVKLWLGRYSGQNATLYATVQYLDSNDAWHDVETLSISPSISYPSCIFEVGLDPSVPMYGVRWIHKDSPNKSGGNNITFAGMTVYGNTNGAITNAFAKVEGSWQDLIGTDIDDIDLGGGGGISEVSIYGKLLKCCLLSTDSTDQFNRSDRWFKRNSNEPIIVLGSSFFSSGSMSYTGYAVISFTGTAVTGTYSSYGDLSGVLKTGTTPLGTTFYVQQMNGMYPPSVASNKIKIQYGHNNNYNTDSILEFIMDDTKLINVANTATFLGDTELLNAFYTLIDSVYQSYYA